MRPASRSSARTRESPNLESQIRELVRQLLQTPPRPEAPTQARRASRNRKKPGSRPSLASRIDHTLLKPDATREQVLAACAEARAGGFASVCLHSHWLPEVTRALKGSATLPIAVIGFPHGSMLPEAKAAETRLAVKAGAREIDMVLNLGRLKSREWKAVHDDIRGVVRAAGRAPVKVILETCLLSAEEKAAAAVISELAGAAFVKTSTGFSTGGATLEDIALLRRIVGPDVRIKASGGIRTRDFAEALIAAGADRLGASSSTTLIAGTPPARASGSY